MIYFSSDPHYYHKNIIKGISNWKDSSSCRPYMSMTQHNNVLVNNFNEV